MAVTTAAAATKLRDANLASSDCCASYARDWSWLALEIAVVVEVKESGQSGMLLLVSFHKAAGLVFNALCLLTSLDRVHHAISATIHALDTCLRCHHCEHGTQMMQSFVRAALRCLEVLQAQCPGRDKQRHRPVVMHTHNHLQM